MTTVLVPLGHDDTAELRPAVAEVLTIARGLGQVVVCATAPVSDALIEQLGHYGVSRLVRTEAPDPAAVTQARTLAAAATEHGCVVVLLPSSFTGKEIAAHTAHQLQAGLLIDVADLRIDGGHLVGGKIAFGGAWQTECEATTPVAVATVRPNAVVGTQVPDPSEVQVVHQDAAPVAPGLELVQRTVHARGEQGRPDLAEAAIVVAGGRGTFGDFELVAELADELHAAVGTTRDCVDEGWMPHDAQIGQTGVTIVPRVYIGAGISGAPHHVGGMSAAGHIIAVNIDDEAPLVQMADLAVIGDLDSVLADASEALRERAGQD